MANSARLATSDLRIRFTDRSRPDVNTHSVTEPSRAGAGSVEQDYHITKTTRKRKEGMKVDLSTEQIKNISTPLALAGERCREKPEITEVQQFGLHALSEGERRSGVSKC